MAKKQSAKARLAEVEAITSELALAYAMLHCMAESYDTQLKAVEAIHSRLRDWHIAGRKDKA